MPNITEYRKQYNKWKYIINYNFRLGIVYFWSDFFWYLSNALSLLVFLYLWQISNRSDSAQVISYLIMGNIFITLCSSQVSWEYYQKIFSGKITSDLIVPTTTIKYFFGISLGYSSKIIISTMISLIPVFVLHRENINISGNFWVIGFLPIGFVIRYFVGSMTGMTSFWIKNSQGVINFYENITPILAGSLVPLSLLPIPFLDKTPFAYLFYYPMQVYMNKYNQQETFLTFIWGIIWCLVLFIMTRIVFRFGLKKNESVGL